MSQKPHNPYAFARAVTEEGGGQEGMSLRDYFAGQALTSMLNAPSTITRETYDMAARESYRFADAMLVERAKEQP